MDTNSSPASKNTDQNLFDLSNDPLLEQDFFLTEVGSIVLDSTITKYLSVLEEAEQIKFEAWLDEHGEDENLLETMAAAYPDFIKILTEEVEAFKDVSKNLLKEK